jgi:glycosyltransferase involved in cell wall biosynthesis
VSEIRARQSSPLRVLQYGVRNPEYPRNARIRAFLTEQYGAVVEVIPAAKGGRLRRYLLAATTALKAMRAPYDLVILSEFSIEMAPFSWAIARTRRAVHLVDFFVGLYETEVEDAGHTDPRSFRAKQLRLADWLAVRLADVCAIDTEVRASRFSGHYKERRRFLTLPVGAPDWAYARPVLRKRGHRPTVLYYGNYLRLHGLLDLVDALADLQRRGLLSARVLFLGDGPDYQVVTTTVRAQSLQDAIEFHPPVSPTDLAEYLHRSDIVLGVFGGSPKARGVIANKVWQGLYAGKIAVTRASPALNEIRDVAGPNLVQVTEHGSGGIAEALRGALARVQANGDADDASPASIYEAYVNRRFREAFDDILRLRRRV